MLKKLHIALINFIGQLEKWIIQMTKKKEELDHKRDGYRQDFELLKNEKEIDEAMNDLLNEINQTPWRKR